ncbi:phosphoenolpyruvate--protein phosphotransferase [Solibacillus sp. CAU 1738]|uniref:phosphoenolpyruvate--protein phosphotransferase n=1 Tax=Solibacillus sp. CAU 1738 TaxID=3140363 RepID=UPI0032607FBA
MLDYHGIAVSSGVAIATAYCLIEPDLSFEQSTISDVNAEIKRLQLAVSQTKEELQEIQALAENKFGKDKAAIFAAHILLLEDPEMLAAIEVKIANGVNAESALHEVALMYIQMFEGMDNAYMQERAADIRDVSNRLLAHLLGVEIPDYSRLSSDVIIVAEDLTPSMTAQLDTKYVKGFITDIGGKTSHSSILARTMGIPAVVGTKIATKQIQHGEKVILDGVTGKIIVDPTKEVIEYYNKRRNSYEQLEQELVQYRSLKSISADGFAIEIAGNIGKPEDVERIITSGGDGVGLFRTEFLYMDRQDLPNEEEQFNIYRQVLEKMQGKPVVVRTLDIGGDKNLPYLKLPSETNPFLGYRAIRLCLNEQEIFRVQIRALLRASVYGNLKIMFPMIATLDEFRAAKEIILEEKGLLSSAGIAVSDSIEIGLMIEIPSAAIIADLFAQEADFLSIGTNDLIQYTLAADRMNENVAYLYQPYHPAILRLIKMIIDAGHKHGKWVGMCGEMAGDEIAIPILLALGLDEFSMNASSILKTRAQISKLSKEQLESHIEHLLMLSTASDVEQYVCTHLIV